MMFQMYPMNILIVFIAYFQVKESVQVNILPAVNLSKLVKLLIQVKLYKKIVQYR